MKNKKVIILVLVIVMILAVIFGFYIATHNKNYLYNQDGTIYDGHKDLINRLKEIENDEERKNMIDSAVEQNFITQQEANALY